MAAASIMLRATIRPISPAVAADLVWVLNDPGLYFSLVHCRGRTPARYQAWLAENLQRQLLPD